MTKTGPPTPTRAPARAPGATRQPGTRGNSGRPAPYRSPADPLGPIDQEDHARDGAHRVFADREGAAARGVVAPLRDPAHEGDGGPRTPDGLGAAPAPRGP